MRTQSSLVGLVPTLAVIFAALGGGGCLFGDRDNLGAPCTITPKPQSSGLSVIQVPTLECDSRMCLQTAGTVQASCTADCKTDGDCEGGPGSQCVAGFACEIPFSTGPFRYRSMCVCRDPSR
jgi:hypothetical protein